MKVLSLAALLGLGNAATQKCVGTVPIDLTFIVDESESVEQVNYDRIMKLMGDVTSLLDIDSGKDRVAMVSFSTNADVNFKLDEQTTAIGVTNAIERTTYDGDLRQWTCTGKAFKSTVDNVICPTCSGRRSNAKNVVVVLTDGNPSPMYYPIPGAKIPICDPSIDRDNELTRLKANADRVLPVGFGESITDSYLQTLSYGISDTSTEKFLDASFEDIDSQNSQGLSSVAEEIANIACETFPPKPQSSPCMTETSSPFKTSMFSATCDPFGCIEWDCERWCTCFEDKNVRNVFASDQCRESLSEICVDDDSPCDCKDI